MNIFLKERNESVLGVDSVPLEYTTIKTLYQGNLKKEQVAFKCLSCVQLFVTPWTAAHQSSLSLTIFWSLLKLSPLCQ